MKKILTAILVLMLSQIALYAQGTLKQNHQRTPTEDSIFKANQRKERAIADSTNNVELTKEIKDVPYIFEGTVIEAKPYWVPGPMGKKRYTEQVIKIHKIFKGNLVCGTVKMISKGGRTYGLNSVEGDFFDKGKSVVFLCKKSTIPDSSLCKSVIDNGTALQFYSFVDYPSITFRSSAFKTYNQLYSRIQQESNIKMEKCDSIDFQKQRDSSAEAYHKWEKKYNKKQDSMFFKKADSAFKRSTDSTKRSLDRHIKTVNPQVQPNQKGPYNQEDNIEYPHSYLTGHSRNNEDDDGLFILSFSDRKHLALYKNNSIINL